MEHHTPKNFIGAIHRFFHSPLAGGVVLIFCTVVALLLSNLDATSAWYASLWHSKLAIGFEGFALSKPLEMWINDALMAVFFFSVGLEIKREIVAGELRSFKQATLPIAAAIGGMVVPALIYTLFNAGTPTQSGWGIPMATDIAFALGVLMLMSKRVPLSLKIFLTALAIVDDLGAILVIAIFYSSTLHWGLLLVAAVVFGFLLLLSKMRVYKMRWYLIPAIILWILFLFSGIHATIAGVLIAMTIPTSAKFSKESFYATGNKLMRKFKSDDVNHVQVLNNEKQFDTLQRLRHLSHNTMAPVQRLEYSLHSVVAFFIMPIFALCNAGVVLSGDMGTIFASDQTIGIILGLVLGKPLGIMLFSYVVLKLRVAAMPSGATWHTLFGVACLGGIGFTMSIFINNLAFSDPAIIAAGKVAILAASVLAAVVGCLVLLARKKTDN